MALSPSALTKPNVLPTTTTPQPQQTAIKRLPWQSPSPTPAGTGGYQMAPQATTPQAGSFSATNNLIGSQVNPGQTSYGFNPINTVSGVAQGGQGYGGVASQSLYDKLIAQANQGVPGNPGLSKDESYINSKVKGALDSVLDGPNRSQLAADQYKLLQDQYEPGYQQNIRQVGQRAAALGRVGAGMTTNDLTGVQQSKDNYFSQQGRGLASEAAGLTLQDRIQQLQAAQDAAKGINAAAQGRYGAGADAYGQNFNNTLTLARDLYGRESDLYGRNANERSAGLDESRMGRNEVRGERDYQYGLSRDAQGDRERQYQMEQQQYGDDFNRAGDLYRYGYAQDPSGIYGQQAGQYANQASDAQAAAGDIFTQWAQNRARQSQPAAASPSQTFRQGTGIDPASLPIPGVKPRTPITKSFG